MTSLRDDLFAAERRLQQAQRDGDVAALDGLLDDGVVAVGPDGTRFRKADDLGAYRSGSSVIDSLTEEDLEVVVAGTTGATFALCTVEGTFGGAPFAGRLRYARTWAHQQGTGWRIIAAQISLAPA